MLGAKIQGEKGGGGEGEVESLMGALEGKTQDRLITDIRIHQNWVGH